LKLIERIQTEPIIIFGTGSRALQFLGHFPHLNIRYFTDNDKRKWEQTYQDKPIICPKDLIQYTDACRIVIASSYDDEIAAQLSGMELVENRHFFRSQSIETEIFGGAYEPGHFYSPIPDMQFVQKNKLTLFNREVSELPGIELNDNIQLCLLERIAEHYSTMPHTDSSRQDLRYTFENNMYRHTDAIFLYGILCEMKPKRIIEVGGGYTTTLMLDVLDTSPELNFSLVTIEPYPDRLLSLLKEHDKQALKLIQRPIQDIPKSVFEQLKPGDILFVDSSHISKIGSDVNYLLFEILPALKAGVYIHFHDVFYPFEYPESWVEKGKFWNEGYMLRAFLQYNHDFQIVCWNHYLSLKHSHTADFKKMEQCAHDSGGSLWLKKQQ